MRSNNVLLVIVLFAVSFSNAFEFTNLAEVKELRSSSYGNSLIETISLTLQNEGSINDIQKLLTDLLFKLNQDQVDSDNEWAKTKADLEALILQLDGQITETTAQIAADQASQKDFEGKRDQAQFNLKQYNDQYSANNNALALNEENRKKDAAEYKESVQQHSDVINAIEQVVAELSKLRGSVSGVNKPSHVVEDIDAETRDRDYAASQLAGAFVQLTRDQTEAMIFAQMATTADQAALEKLIALLEQLSDKTKESLNADEAAEASSLLAYNTLNANLNADNVELSKNIEEQTKRLNEYVAEIARLVAKIAEEQKLLASLIVQRDEAKKELAEKQAQYLSDKQQRDNERAVIERIQKIVNERLANTSKFLRSQTGAF